MDALTDDAREVCRAVMLKLYRATGSATQDEVGKLLGVSRVQVSRWMSGQSGMGLKPRLAAKEYLEV